jgi:hypothetical protein
MAGKIHVVTGPTPTTGQYWTGHAIVWIACTAIVHTALKDAKLTPNERLFISVLSGLAVSYAHHEFDAPVAKAIAKAAA